MSSTLTQRGVLQPVSSDLECNQLVQLAATSSQMRTLLRTQVAACERQSTHRRCLHTLLCELLYSVLLQEGGVLDVYDTSSAVRFHALTLEGSVAWTLVQEIPPLAPQRLSATYTAASSFFEQLGIYERPEESGTVLQGDFDLPASARTRQVLLDVLRLLLLQERATLQFQVGGQFSMVHSILVLLTLAAPQEQLVTVSQVALEQRLQMGIITAPQLWGSLFAGIDPSLNALVLSCSILLRENASL